MKNPSRVLRSRISNSHTLRSLKTSLLIIVAMMMDVALKNFLFWSRNLDQISVAHWNGIYLGIRKETLTKVAIFGATKY